MHSQSFFLCKSNIESPEEGAFLKHLFTYCEQTSVLRREGKHIVAPACKSYTQYKGTAPEPLTSANPSREDARLWLLRLTGTVALLHRVEEETDSCSQQQVQGLVQQFG